MKPSRKSIRPASVRSWITGILIIFISGGLFAQVTTGGSGNWSSTTVNAPWAGGVVPVAGQTVTINAGHTVTLDVNTAVTLASITINPGGTLITTDPFTIDATTITVGGTFTNGSGGAVTVTDWFVNAGATYDHAFDGGTIPVASGTRSWAATSNCIITGVLGNAPAPAGYAVPAPGFGNFTWNSPGQTTNIYLEASFNVQGNLEILDTGLPIAPGTRAVRMSPDAGSYTINVAGNFLVDNATFKMNNSSGDCDINVTGNVTVDNSGFLTLCTGAANSTATLTVAGNVVINNGTLLMQEDNQTNALGVLDVNGDMTIGAAGIVTETEALGKGSILFTGAGTQTFTNGGTMSNQIDITVGSAVTLQMGSPTSIFSGTGTFFLPGDGTLGVTSVDGITTAGATGNVQVTGTRTYSTGASYIYNGSGDQDVGDGLTQNTPTNITINNPGNVVSLGAATSLTGDLIITAGTLDTNGQTVTINGGGAQQINGAGPSQAFDNLVVNKGGGTLTVTGGINTITAANYTQTAGNFSAPTTFTVSGNVTLTAGTLTAGANTNVGGNWTNNGGTFTPGANTVTFNGGGAQAINGTTLNQTFNNVVVNKGGGTLSAGGLTSLTAANFTVSAGTFTAPATATYSGNVLLSAGTYTAGTVTNVAGDWTNNGGTFTPGGGTVTFDGGGAQSVNGTAATQTFNNLVINKPGGSVTVGGSTTTLNVANLTETSGDFNAPATFSATGGITLTAGTFTAGTNTNVAGNFTHNGGSFAASGGTLTMNGTGAQVISGAAPATTFNNLTIGSSSSTSFSKAMVVGAILNLLDGSSLTVGGIDLTVNGVTNIGGGTSGSLFFSSTVGTKIFEGVVIVAAGATWSNAVNEDVTFRGGVTNSGTFTSGSGTHLFDTNPQFLNGTLSIANVNVSGINLTNQGSLTVRASLSGTGTFIQDVASVLNINNSATVATFDATGAGNSVHYNGSSQAVLVADYQNLTINQSGGEAVLTGDTDVNGVLTLSARNLNLGGYNLTIGATGSISVAGPSASKMIIDGGGGELRKEFTADGAFVFPFGDNTGMLEYSPITVTVTAAGYGAGAYVAATVTDAKHPNNASTSNFLTRYWGVETSGLTTPSVDVSATYPNADINGVEGNISAAQLNGTFAQTTNPWVKYVALAGNTLSATGAPLTDGQLSSFSGIRSASPTITIDNGAAISICEGTSVVLTTTLGNGLGTMAYVWSPTANLNFLTVPNPTYTGSTPGLENVVVTVYDANGISATDNINITTDAQPTANAGAGGDVCGIGVGNPFTFTGVASVGTGTWTQQSGPGVSTFGNANLATTTVSVDAYGTYVYRWTEVNNTCSDFDEVTVNFWE
ncbi:MAG: beta strand repeat-containing protein, partial [Cyclobacteriaceae bacterium]